MLNRYSVSQLRGYPIKYLKSHLEIGRYASTTSRDSGAVFVEKCEEDPVIVVSEKNDIDIIGAPDSISNLRPIVRKKFPDETSLQRQLREMQNATQLWNQEFWASHNTKFVKERQAYMRKKTSPEKRELSAEEMSEFYKEFLDKNWTVHVRYNFEWYKKNFALLLLAMRVCLTKLTR